MVRCDVSKTRLHSYSFFAESAECVLEYRVWHYLFPLPKRECLLTWPALRLDDACFFICGTKNRKEHRCFVPRKDDPLELMRDTTYTLHNQLHAATFLVTVTWNIHKAVGFSSHDFLKGCRNQQFYCIYDLSTCYDDPIVGINNYIKFIYRNRPCLLTTCR
jgi:hypothetical protein